MRELEAKAVEEIKKEDIIEFYNTFVINSSPYYTILSLLFYSLPSQNSLS